MSIFIVREVVGRGRSKSARGCAVASIVITQMAPYQNVTFVSIFSCHFAQEY